jgi:NAD(P)-dependent dehydrogenase (short-subunit alcohol dehydrogenase family)
MSKTYLITGASSGFGAELAKAALNRGDRVVLAARRKETLDAIVKGYPDSALAVPLDATDEAQRKACVSAALERFGRIDVLANIAGRGSLGAAEEFTLAQLRDQLEVNFFAAAEMTRAVLPTMRHQGSGHILNLTSIGGLAAYPGFGPYCASKFALEGWSEALRTEVAPFGIKVTIVEPGAFRTEFAGSKNMRPDSSIDAYRKIIEPVETYLYGADGKQPGDPRKAAAVMMQVVEASDPPLRLMLGSDAFVAWESKLAVVQKDMEVWRRLGEDTAFDSAAVRPVGG